VPALAITRPALAGRTRACDGRRPLIPSYLIAAIADVASVHASALIESLRH
jgi:hypothetical protein